MSKIKKKYDIDGIDNDIQISALLSKLCLFSENL